MEFLQNSRSQENEALNRARAIFEQEGVYDATGNLVIEQHDTICELRYNNWSGIVV